MSILSKVAIAIIGWGLAMLASVSFLSDLSWMSALTGGWPANSSPGDGALAVASNSIGAVVSGWQTVTQPLATLFAGFLPETFAREATDATVVATLLIIGAVRALTMGGAGGKVSAASDEKTAERLLRQRLPAIYRRIEGLDERATDKTSIEEDAEALAPWCAKFNEFLQTKEDAFEVGLDLSWLATNIQKNVEFDFGDVSIMQAGNWKNAISQAVTQDLHDYMVGARRDVGAGPRMMGRVGRRAIAAASVLGLSAAVDAAYLPFAG